jgi:hypothetical protein
LADRTGDKVSGKVKDKAKEEDMDENNGPFAALGWESKECSWRQEDEEDRGIQSQNEIIHLDMYYYDKKT